MITGYWNRVLSNRISRRRALAVGGGAVAGTAFLAACGSGSSGGSGGATTTQSTGLLSQPKDTSSQAVQGGIFQTSMPLDIGGADPHKAAGTTPLQRLTDFYTYLLRYDKGKQGVTGKIIGQSAESWEVAPDGQTITFHIRPNHLFDPRSPTNSRPMTAADVKYSWDRFLMYSSFSGDLDPKITGNAIQSLNATDDKTVVVKLNYPYLSALDLFTHFRYLSIMPAAETDANQYDTKTQTRGAGPFMLDSWQPSLNVTWKRNPNWFEKGIPYLDGVVENTLQDKAATLAQFEAGTLWDGAGYQPEDILRVKKDHPEMVLYQTYPALGTGSAWTLSQQKDSVLNDVRGRRALSMLVDRDLYLQALNATDNFTSAGLPVTANWDSHIPSPNPEWLDPKGTGLGDGAQYFKHDVADAKKLLSAAGYNGESLVLHFSERDNTRTIDVMHGMLSDGLNIEEKILDYTTAWRDVCQRSGGQGYNGVCYNTGSGLNAELHITRWYTGSGSSKAALGTSTLTPLAEKIKTSSDRNAQIDLIKEFQKEASMEMPLLPNVGNVTGFALAWPWLENLGAITGDTSVHLRAYYWYNKAKDTKSKPS